MNFYVLSVCVFVVFPYVAHGMNLTISVPDENKNTTKTVSVHYGEDLRFWFETNQPVSLARCYQGIFKELLHLKLKHGEGYVFQFDLTQIKLNIFTEGPWICSFESKTETKYIILNILIIHEVRLTILNKVINTVSTYTTHTSNYYYKEGDVLRVSCLKPDVMIKGERKTSASTFRLEFDKSSGRENYFYRYSDGNVVDLHEKSFALTQKDNGSVLSCIDLKMYAHQRGQRTETSVKLVLVPGHASTTTSPTPTTKMTKVTLQTPTTHGATSRRPTQKKTTTPTDIAETSTKRQRRPKMPRVTTESIKRETSETTTEITDTVHKIPTWLLPVAASVSTILIIGTTLIGGWCVYYHAKKLTPRPPAPLPIVPQQSFSERVYYTIFEDHTYTYIDPVGLRTVDTPHAQTKVNK